MSGPARIAVVRNRARDGVLFDSHRPSPERYGKRTITQVVQTLRERYDEVTCLEGDVTLPLELARFLGEGEEPTGLVLNLAYGVQGDARYTHVPAMLELAGVPYTGAGPLGHSVSLDKVTAKQLMRDANIPTPAWAAMGDPGEPLPDHLRYPLIVKPRRESTSNGVVVVRDDDELADAVAENVERYHQEALVETFVAGRELCLGLLGSDEPVVLPAVELDFGGRSGDDTVMRREDKFHDTDDEPGKLCPAPLDDATRAEVERIARQTFALCHCRDYARVDVRLDAAGRPWVLEINSMASLGSGGSYVRAAAQAGLDFAGLLERIIEGAWARHLAGRALTADAAT
jgi:D-alanine-D-alanine ligase